MSAIIESLGVKGSTANQEFAVHLGDWLLYFYIFKEVISVYISIYSSTT